jgi:NADPH-dependent 2,4-dienoyl-CoA reductase/sulfur reductase-like enzyme
MQAPRLLVVGAGVAGLTIAIELGRDVPITMIDRLPAPGGVLGYEHPIIRDLLRRAHRGRVEYLLGTTALRWIGNQLLVGGPRGIEWLAGLHLAFCGGTRPSTAAELKLAGDRLAGVMPATVAIHLMEAGVRIARRAVVIGQSDWAVRAAQALGHQGARIAVVLIDGDARAPFGDAQWSGWTPVRIHGTGRVSELLLARDGFQLRLPCDAVILGARVRPLRNIDGAVFGGEGVTFVQLVAENAAASEVVEAARTAATALRKDLSGGNHEGEFARWRVSVRTDQPDG